ncbi:MAG: DUF5013 domain-containing protein [Daejeonella sp.]
MNKFLSLILLMCTIAMVSCAKTDAVIIEPVEVKRPFADYAISPGDDPFTFKFENKSNNYKSIEWRFGDDSLSTDISPTHIFLKPGIFEVNLKATAEDGSTARKLLVIKIIADSIANFGAVKTGVPNEVKFSSTTKASIKSLVWKFHDGTTSTDLTPTKTYTPGQFNDATLILTTNKGSVVTLTRKVSSKGSLIDVTNRYLLNTGPDFIPSQRIGRWGIVADWDVNNAVKQRAGGMGSWDSFAGGQWLSLESWGGETWITNGKISQTMTLPAGTYFFNAIYRDYAVRDGSGKTYIVMAEGDVLPDVNDVETKSLGFYRLRGGSPLDVVASMTITKTTKVSIGHSSTMQANNQTLKCRQVRLYKAFEP